MWSAKRCANHHVLPYIVAQVAGAIFGAGVLYLIASGKLGWQPNGFASNGYDRLSSGNYGLGSCLLIEFLLTFFFLFIIIGTTSKSAASGFAGIPIGFALVLIHLISIPVTNTSVNPARSLDPPGPCASRPLATWALFLSPVLFLAAGAVVYWITGRQDRAERSAK